MSARMQIPGLHRRDGGDVFALRIIIPTALRVPFYEGREKFRLSLHTTDPREARTRALAMHAEWAEKFEQQRRQLNPTTQVNVTTELAAVLAQRARARVLAFDDAVRYDPKALKVFLAVFQPIRYFSAGLPPDTSDPDEAETGMTPAQLLRLTQVHETLRLGLSTALQTGQLNAGKTWAEVEARELGLSVDWSKHIPHVLTIMRAVVSAWIAVGNRNLGAPVDTPPMQDASSVIAEVTEKTGRSQPLKPTRGSAERNLNDVRDDWAQGKKQDARNKTDRALRMLESVGLMKPLSKLTRHDALAFRDHIRTELRDRTEKTQSDVLACIQALLNHAVKERGWLDANPWAGTSIAKGRRTNQRDPWTHEALSVLLGHSLWTAGTLLASPKAGGWAAYWLPLLALHTGARQAELCQLRVGDVRVEDGVLLIDINENADGHGKKSVKSGKGVRKVPVHQRLVSLGFADYVEARRREGAALLFDQLPSSKTRSASVNYSDSFRALCTDVGVYQRYRDFHAFRTTVSTRLRAVYPALDESLIDAVMGHEEGGSVGRSHYTLHAPSALVRVVSELMFPAADKLSRVYPVSV